MIPGGISELYWFYRCWRHIMNRERGREGWADGWDSPSK